MCLAIPAKVVELAAAPSTSALVEVMGVRRHVDLGLLQDDPPQTGDWVLVHVGFAMSKISEEQALDQLRVLSMLGEQEAVLEEVQGYESTELVPAAPMPAAETESLRRSYEIRR